MSKPVVHPEIVHELKEFFKDFTYDPDWESDFKVFKKGEYSYTSGIYFPDLNIEINHQHKLCGIRCDDDFWLCAVLPYEFQKYEIQDIAAALWPDIEDLTFNPPSVYDENGVQMSEHWNKEVEVDHLKQFGV